MKHPLITLLTLLIAVPAMAQTPEALNNLEAARSAYDAARDVVVRQNAEAISALNIATDAGAIAKLRSEVDALTLYLAACQATARTAAAALESSTTLAGQRAALRPLIRCWGGL